MYANQRVEAKTISDLWFQAVWKVLQVGNRFVVDKGSYAGQTRLEFDYFTGIIDYPNQQDILPVIPPGCNLPAPVEHDYVYGGPDYSRSYVEYVMTPTIQENEAYTYGERLTKFKLTRDIQFWHDLQHTDIIDFREPNEKILFKEGYDHYVNQIEWVIETYKTRGHRNNQMVLQVAKPDDILLLDPPCLRSIDTRVQQGFLHFIIYFRSWDLWGGLPANLAGLVALQEYMASEIGVKVGKMVVESKGLHLYGYAEKLAKMRCMIEEKGIDK